MGFLSFYFFQSDKDGKKDGVEASEKYLVEFLRDKGDDIEFADIMEEIHRFY